MACRILFPWTRIKSVCPLQWKYRVLMLDCQGSPVPIFLLTVGWGHSALRADLQFLTTWFFSQHGSLFLQGLQEPSASDSLHDFCLWSLDSLKSICLIRSVPPVLKGRLSRACTPGLGVLEAISSSALMNLLWRHIPSFSWDLFYSFLLSKCFVPSTVLGTRNTALMAFTFLAGETGRST